LAKPITKPLISTIFAVQKKYTTMKKLFLIAGISALCVMAQAQSLTTPQPSPTQTIKQNFGVGNIELNYSRPAKKGRKIMGDLVPYGKVWRTGANAATTLTFSDDVTIGGKEVKAGKYGLLTIPGANKWIVIISKDATVNSPSAYKEENDLVRVEVSPMQLPMNVENFTINFSDITATACNLQMMWENTYLQFPISNGSEAKVLAQIDNAMNKDNKPYFAAAQFYYDNGKDAKQALAWVDKAVETNKDAFWMYLLKARLHNKLGDKTNAVAAAKTVIDLATKAKNDDYVKMATELLATIK
jgi:tetratricopeptide (TPR) repeat protein